MAQAPQRLRRRERKNITAGTVRADASQARKAPSPLGRCPSHNYSLLATHFSLCFPYRFSRRAWSMRLATTASVVTISMRVERALIIGRRGLRLIMP